MPVTANRQEIRNEALLRTGWSTDSDDLVEAVVLQFNSFISQAAKRTYLDCPWVSRIRQARVTAALGVSTVAYPTTDTSGNTIAVAESDVLAVSRWDGSEYVRMRRRAIREDEVPDATLLSGASLEAEYGDPLWWDVRATGILIAPAPDEETTLLLEVATNPDIGAGGSPDTNESVTDAELIILYVCHLYHRGRREMDLAEAYLSDYAQRLRKLKATEHPGTPIAPGLGDRMRRRRRRYWPRGTDPFTPSV